MTLVPRILPITQGTIVDIPHTAERAVQVLDLLRCRVAAVAVGAVGHLQIVHDLKEAMLADGALSLSPP